MPRFTLFVAAVLLTLSVGPTAFSQGSDIQSIIESTYRNAVVKIIASSNTPVFKEGKNICRSEGTGFFVNSDSLVTASHVVTLDPKCGPPIVLVRSRKHSWERLAQVSLSQNDVAILKVETIPRSAEMCSLLLASTDVFENRGFRYGIPDGLNDPEAIGLRIGEENNEFRPLVVLTPAPVHHGDSGGPILYLFNVTGLMHARHEMHTNFGLMIRGETIRNALRQAGVVADDSNCNPARRTQFVTGVTRVTGAVEINIFGGSNSESNHVFQARFNDDLKKALSSTRIASPLSQVILGDDSKIIIDSPRDPPKQFVVRDKEQQRKLEGNRKAVANATQAVADSINKGWWDAYLDFLEKCQSDIPNCKFSKIKP